MWWVGVSTEGGDGWDSPLMACYVQPDKYNGIGWGIAGLY